MDFIVFTDGSCRGNNTKNNRYGGIGVFFSDDNPMNLSEPFRKSYIANNAIELYACIRAIEQVISNKEYRQNVSIINLVTDSRNVITYITKYCNKWKKYNWKKSSGEYIKNMKLVKKLHKLYCLHKVKFIHQSAHTSFSKQSDYSSNEFKIWYGNYMADKLSQEASALKIQDNESLSDTSDDYSYESDFSDDEDFGSLVDKLKFTYKGLGPKNYKKVMKKK